MSALLALVALVALAQEPPTGAAPTAAPTPTESPDCDPPAAVTGVRAGQKEAYLCLAETDAGRDAILAALDAGGEHPERLTRALALWLLHHDAAEWDPALVRRLSAADRRILADGVRARRGRKSPVPDHDRVFSQFEWYKPRPDYHEGRLTPVDRANIRMADSPPPPPPPVAEAPAAAATPAPSTGVCGCNSGAAAFLLAPLALVRRRRC
jgi:hypothetical protein